MLAPAATLSYSGIGGTTYGPTATAPTNVGTYLVTASFSGNANYGIASNGAALTIATANQTIDFSLAALPAKTYGDSPFDIAGDASATSGLTVEFASTTPSVCTVSVTTVTLKGAGDCMIEATQPGNGTWDPAIPVDQTFHVAQTTLTVTASSPTDGAYGDAAPAVTPGYSGFVSPDGPGSLTAEPTCTTAYAKGDAPGDYATSCSGGVAADYAFSFVDGTFHVAKASQSIVFTSEAAVDPKVGDTYVPSAGATSGLDVTIAIDAASATICSISGGTVTFDAVGLCLVNADQAGDANWNAATQVQQPIGVGDTAPVCADASAAVVMNVPSTADGGCSDLEHDPLAYAIATNGAHGTATIDSSGRWTYTPSLNYRGPDSFTYHAFDGILYSADASITVTVTNQPMDARNDGFRIAPVTPSRMNVLANDSPGLGEAGQPLTVTAVTQGAKGRATTDGTTVTYDPSGCATGTDTVTYTVTDGQYSATKSVYVTIQKPGQPIDAPAAGTLSANPVTDTPSVSFISGSTMSSTMPMRIAWCGVAASSMKGYRVMESNNSGASYGTTVTSATTATSVTRSLTVNTRYAWEVRATDTSNRTGAYAFSAVSRVVRFEDSNANLKYSSGWTTAKSSSYSGGSEKYATSSSASATITLTGARAFAIVASRATTRGSFRVYVDGTLVATVSEHNSTTLYKRVLYARSVSTGAGVSHKIVIKPYGNGRITLDAIIGLY